MKATLLKYLGLNCSDNQSIESYKLWIVASSPLH